MLSHKTVLLSLHKLLAAYEIWPRYQIVAY